METFHEDFAELISECEKYKRYLQELATEKEAIINPPKGGKINRQIWQKRQKDTYPPLTDYGQAQEKDLVSLPARFELMQDILKLAKSTENQEFLLIVTQEGLRSVQNKLDSSLNRLVPLFSAPGHEEVVDLDSKVNAILTEKGWVSTILALADKIYARLEIEEFEKQQKDQALIEKAESELNEGLPENKPDSFSNPRARYNDDYFELITGCEEYINYLNNFETIKDEVPSHQNVGQINRSIWRQRQENTYLPSSDFLKGQENDLINPVSRLEIMQAIFKFAKSTPNSEIAVSTLQISLRAFQASLQSHQDRLWPEFKKIEPEAIEGLILKIQTLGEEESFISKLLKLSNKFNQNLKQNDQQLNGSKVNEKSNQQLAKEEVSELTKTIIRSPEAKRNRLNKLSQLEKICKDYEQYLEKKLDQNPMNRIAWEKKQVVSNIIIEIGSRDKVNEEKYTAIKGILKANETLLTKRQSSSSHQFFKLMMNILTLGLVSKVKRDSFQFWKTRGEIYKDKLKTIINKEPRMK